MKPVDSAPTFDDALAAAIDGREITDAGLDPATQNALAAVANEWPTPSDDTIAAARAAFAAAADTE